MPERGDENMWRRRRRRRLEISPRPAPAIAVVARPSQCPTSTMPKTYPTAWLSSAGNWNISKPRPKTSRYARRREAGTGRSTLGRSAFGAFTAPIGLPRSGPPARWHFQPALVWFIRRFGIGNVSLFVDDRTCPGTSVLSFRQRSDEPQKCSFTCLACFNVLTPLSLSMLSLSNSIMCFILLIPYCRISFHKMPRHNRRNKGRAQVVQTIALRKRH